MYGDDYALIIDMMELKRMMEKLGQPKTHLELKKMIAEVDSNNSGTCVYSLSMSHAYTDAYKDTCIVCQCFEAILTTFDFKAGLLTCWLIYLLLLETISDL